MPSVREVAHSALVTIAGAIVAAWLVRQSPELRQWLRESWQ